MRQLKNTLLAVQRRFPGDESTRDPEVQCQYEAAMRGLMNDAAAVPLERLQASLILGEWPYEPWPVEGRGPFAELDFDRHVIKLSLRPGGRVPLRIAGNPNIFRRDGASRSSGVCYVVGDLDPAADAAAREEIKRLLPRLPEAGELPAARPDRGILALRRERWEDSLDVEFN